MGLFDKTSGNTKAGGKTATIANLTAFQLALREGMGLAYACALSGNDPAYVTEIMKSDKVFLENCRKLVMGANLDRLTAASEYTEKREWEKAEKARQDARKVAKLRLWGCEGNLNDVDEDKVFDVFCQLEGDYQEMAVCFAAKEAEMKSYVEGRQELMRMMKIMQKQWNDGLDTEGKKRKR